MTLSLDYAGKTLTIAQSSPLRSEKEGTVWPCAVTLYCGHAYESTLVEESFQTAVLVTLSFAAGTLLLALFTLQTLQGTPDLGTLCGELMAFSGLQGDLTALTSEKAAQPDCAVCAIALQAFVSVLRGCRLAN